MQTPQQIAWKVDWRYLASCPPPCTDPENDPRAIWQKGFKNGVLTTPDSSTAGDITTAEPGTWSDAITIAYLEPQENPFQFPFNANLPE